jgi:mannitol operon repressor
MTESAEKNFPAYSHLPGKTVRSFLIAAVELLTEAVNILVLQVFRKDDYAVKYAVEPLLDGSGPLGDLSLRLKLIYGLGVISRHEYEDAELLMALREELNHDGSEYAFTDDEILGPLGELHCVSALPPAPLFDDSDADLLGKNSAINRSFAQRWYFSDRADFRISLKKPFRNNTVKLLSPGSRPADKVCGSVLIAPETSPLSLPGSLPVRDSGEVISSDTP